MRLVGSWAALWAALATFAQASFVVPKAPTAQNVAAPANSLANAKLLRGSANAVAADITALKQQINSLKTDKKGLQIAVRRLLKANQTEAQKKMLNALRGAKKEATEASKRFKEVERQDKAHMDVLKTQEQAAELKLAEQVKKFDNLMGKEIVQEKHESELEQELKKKDADEKAQSASAAAVKARLVDDEVTLADLRKKGSSSGSRTKQLQVKVEQLTDRNAHLEDEVKGLESTVKKLWTGSATDQKSSLLKLLDEDQKQLATMKSEKEAEEKQFAQEKSDLSWKLSDSELKLDVDLQAMTKLKAENQRLTEEGAKAVEGLKDQNKKLAVAVLKERKKASDEVQAVQTSLGELQGKVVDAALQNQKLISANNKLAVESAQNKQALEKIKADKESDEHVFAEELKELRKKLNETEVLEHEKEAELKDVKSKGQEFYTKQWDTTRASLEGNLAAEHKSAVALQAQVTELKAAQKQKDAQVADSTSQGTQMRNMMQNVLKEQQSKLAYAEEKENIALARVDKLDAENKDLQAELQKEKEIEPKMKDVLKKDKVMQDQNRILAAAHKSESDQITVLKNARDAAVQYSNEQQKKLDFAVDQENTEMLAVKLLQGENQKLKESLSNQTDLQTQLQQTQEDAKAKVESQNQKMRTLDTQASEADKKAFALKDQVSELKKSNALLEDQYIAERTKLLSMADQDSTNSLALKVLQGENQKLKDQLDRAAEEQSNMQQAVQNNEQKAGAVEDAESRRDTMQRELAAMHIQQEALQLKNDQLQETVVSMAAKTRDDAFTRKYSAESEPEPQAPKPVQQEDQAEESHKDKLEQASSALDGLMSQLHSNSEAEHPKTEDASGGAVDLQALMSDDAPN